MYNLRKIMGTAWALFRRGVGAFGECLRRAWMAAKINAQRIQEAAQGREVDTWAGWREKGLEVAHGSKAIFQVPLLWISKADDAVYLASFFERGQVCRVDA